MMKFAFIGYGNHARKIESIVENINPEYEIYKISRKFSRDELLPETKGIFICSPNSTHIEFIKKLVKFNNKIPIYCEKPIIDTHLDFEKNMNILDQVNLFPGFNLRRSNIFKTIQENQRKYELGKFKSFFIKQSYPFGLRKSYKDSWKSDSAYAPLGIFENLSIHFIDLAFYIFGSALKSNIVLSDYINKVPMAGDFLINHENGVISSIHNSYSERLNSNLILNLENGQIILDENSLKVYFPTLNIDKKTNLCIESNLINEVYKNFNDFIKESLSLSVEKFVYSIKSNKIPIDDSNFTTKNTFEFIRKVSTEYN